MIFYLGTHNPAWLSRVSIPLCVSYHRLQDRKSLPKAQCEWVLDSGGFTELKTHGKWTIDPERYADDVRVLARDVGRLVWAAPQDWMCEEKIRRLTKFSVVEHQRRTTESVLFLRERAPEIPWIPVIQGWTAGEYEDHVDLYERSGIDLTKEPVVGVGSVCRRTSNLSISRILLYMALRGIRIHAFGLKGDALRWQLQQPFTDRHLFVSSDSLAWSFNARKNQRLPGHTHKNCQNCLEYALMWREELLSSIERVEPQPTQGV
jgi:hypothetical protein